MRLKTILLFLSVLALSLSSCEKAPGDNGNKDNEPEKKVIKAVTGNSLNVGYESVVLTGSAVIPDASTGDLSIGVHYSLSEGMIPDNSTEIKALSFDGSYSFSVHIEGLKPDTKYYYRTFVKESGVYTFGDTKSFTTTKAPTIKLSSESASFDFMEHIGSFDATVENPVTGGTLSASTTDAWITDVKVSGNTVSYKVAENNSGAVRSGSIKVLYGAFDATFNVAQTATSLSLSPKSAETDYTSKSLSFTCSIDNPVDGLSLTASSDESWITDVQVSGTTVSYKVAENNSGAQRTGKIRLTYGTISKEFSVTQTYTAPVVSLTPASQNTDYAAKSLSFTFAIDAPRQGVTASATTTDTWITNIQVSGTTVNYKVDENNSGASRIGKVKLTYAAETKAYLVTQGMKPVAVPVDLGLSVKWATCNVGASKPEDYGGYYQWAGTADVTSTSIYLDWNNCPYHTGSDYKTGWTKYVPSDNSSYWSGTGSPDNKTVLDPSDDVASVTWKGTWRMPTHAEWTELRNTDNCSWTWTSINGINGYKVQSKKSGYTDNWIFLPAAGHRDFDFLCQVGSDGYYLSSLVTYDPSYVVFMGFDSSHFSGYGILSRYLGISVRPVSE